MTSAVHVPCEVFGGIRSKLARHAVLGLEFRFQEVKMSEIMRVFRSLVGEKLLTRLAIDGFVQSILQIFPCSLGGFSSNGLVSVPLSGQWYHFDRPSTCRCAKWE